MVCSLHWLPKQGVRIGTESGSLTLEMSVKDGHQYEETLTAKFKQICWIPKESVVYLVGDVYFNSLKHCNHEAVATSCQCKFLPEVNIHVTVFLTETESKIYSWWFDCLIKVVCEWTSTRLVSMIDKWRFWLVKSPFLARHCPLISCYFEPWGLPIWYLLHIYTIKQIQSNLNMDNL